MSLKKMLGSRYGMTLMEVMIVVAMTGIIFYGIARLIRNVSTMWTKSSSQIILQEEARTAMHYIEEELQKAKSGSVDCLGPYDSSEVNSGITGDFEIPFGTGSPVGWNAMTTSQAKVSSSSNPRSGYYCIVVNPLLGPSTGYLSSTFTVCDNSTYYVSAWVKLGMGSTCRIAAGCGSPFGVSFFTDYTPAVLADAWQWKHVVMGSNLSGGPRTDYRICLYNLTAGTSVYFDDVSFAHQNLVMSPVSAATTMIYQITSASGNRTRRIRYAPATAVDSARLNLDQWNGSGDINNNANWYTIDPNPLCNYVSYYAVVNNVQESYDQALRLVISDPSAVNVEKQRRYDLTNKVVPYLP